MTIRIFVDEALADGLGAELARHGEVVVLDPGQHPLRQMCRSLVGLADIDAIHVYCHGSPGRLAFGGAEVNGDTVRRSAEELKGIGEALGIGGDILLYGCEAGAGPAGAAFLRLLSQATGADVAASSQRVGNAALGGSWVLDRSVGTVDTEPIGVRSFTGVLAAPVLTPAGQLDASFDGDGRVTTSVGATDSASAVLLLPDGKLIVGGSVSNSIPFGSDFFLLRYGRDGSLDASFSGDGIVTTQVTQLDDNLYEMALLPDGRMLAAGMIVPFNWDAAVVRYGSDGAPDATFGTGGIVRRAVEGYSAPSALLVQPDGKFVIAGTTGPFTNDYDFYVLRYHADGTPDTTFDGDGMVVTRPGTSWDELADAALQSDGKIVGVGRVGDQFALVRYNIDGQLDTTFDGDGLRVVTLGQTAAASDIVLQTNGKIVVVGATSQFGNSDIFVARFNADGSLDTTFDGDGIVTAALGSVDSAKAVELQPDGGIVVAGRSDGNLALLRYHPNGTLDSSFSDDGKLAITFSGLNASASDVVLQHDGSILVVGAGSGNTGSDVVLARVSGGALPTQSAQGGTLYSMTVPANLYTDADGDTLSYSAALAGGSTLPSWLTFAPVTRTFSGTPTESDADAFDVRLQVSDGQNTVDALFAFRATPAVGALGTDTADTLYGGTGSDTLVGLAGDDSLFSGSNADTLRGGAGNDILHGGLGVDTARLAGSPAEYAFINLQGVLTVVDKVSNRDGVDRLFDVEQIHFDTSQSTTSVVRIDQFTPLEYVATYSDLISSLGTNVQAAFDHYVQSGRIEGRTASFDGMRYIASYLDLGAGLGVNPDAGARHYIEAGRLEGRVSNFDALRYIASYADLVEGLGPNSDAGVMHFVSAGRVEGRVANFDGLRYVASYADLIAGLGANADAGIAHFVNAGHGEGRVASFDGLRYVASYSDLVVGLGANPDAGAWHYIAAGHAEGRAAHFDAAQYLANYGDLAAAFGANLQSATAHFIYAGYYEGRTDQPL